VICRHIYPIPCYIVNIEIKDYNSINKESNEEQVPEVFLVKTVTDDDKTEYLSSSNHKRSTFLNRPMKKK